MYLEVFERAPGGQLSSIGMLEPGGAVLGGFHERGVYLFRIPSSECRLFVDDAQLSSGGTGGYWLWEPGFYAGEVDLELESPEYSEPLRYKVDVAPAPHKSGRQQYLDYIEDITEYAPDLLSGSEPARHNLGGLSHLNATIWIRYVRLRSFIDAYLVALRFVCERPLFYQRHYRQEIPVHLARRIDRNSVRRLVANPTLLAAVVGSDVGAESSQWLDNRLDVPFSEMTLDHPANRLLVTQLKGVQRLVEQLIQAFDQASFSRSATETDIQSRLSRKIDYLQSLKRSLKKISAREPFRSVRGRQSGVAGINAVSGSPHYARSHRMGVRILREGISKHDHDEQHYLAPTWQIYEVWCFVAVARELQRQLPGYQWTHARKQNSADMILEGAKGTSRVKLYGQLRCPSAESENCYGYTSISRERRPDLVLEYADAKSQGYICLDSKYSTTSQNVLEAMASAHIYRDSLRWQGRKPGLSLLLLPHTDDVPLLSARDYIDRHGVGCIKLGGSQDAVSLVESLLVSLKVVGE